MPVERLGAMTCLEVGELAGAAPDVDARAVDDRDAGRVVAAVFEPPQPLDQDGNDLLGADVADDAAHESSLQSQFRVQRVRTSCSGLGLHWLCLLVFRCRPNPLCLPAAPRPMPSAPAGTSSVIAEPAAT